MGLTQVTGAAAAISKAAAEQAQTAKTTQAAASGTASGDSRTLSEMMKDAKEKAEARRDQFKGPKNRQSYGDVPIEAYSRLARAKNQAGVNAAASYARRKIVQLQAAKRTDSENAQQIQAAINQLRKAVTRAGKKKQDLAKEQAAEKRRVKMIQEKRLREAKRQRMELRRTQALRSIRESGYIREAETDSRMQSYIAKTQMELRSQAQSLAAQVGPSLETAVQQYAAASESASAASAEGTAGGEINVQA